jgi:hypothetical protein
MLACIPADKRETFLSRAPEAAAADRQEPAGGKQGDDQQQFGSFLQDRSLSTWLQQEKKLTTQGVRRR